MGRAVVISGTPGTGKTVIAKKLALKLNGVYINLNDLALSNNLCLYYDEERNSCVIDEDRVKDLAERVIKQCREYCIVDSHYGEIISGSLIEKIFVLRLHPRELMLRLIRRGWPKSKVRENVEAELLAVCTSNALNQHPKDKVCEINVTGRAPNAIVNDIVSILKGGAKCVVGVDWLEEVDAVLINKLLNAGNPN